MLDDLRFDLRSCGGACGERAGRPMKLPILPTFSESLQEYIARGGNYEMWHNILCAQWREWAKRPHRWKDVVWRAEPEPQ